jgi:hypothetical protein
VSFLTIAIVVAVVIIGVFIITTHHRYLSFSDITPSSLTSPPTVAVACVECSSHMAVVIESITIVIQAYKNDHFLGSRDARGIPPSLPVFPTFLLSYFDLQESAVKYAGVSSRAFSS